jgi:biopolymer transport protein ExbB
VFFSRKIFVWGENMSSDVIISLFDSIPLWVMLLPILVCSIIAIAIIIERLIFFKRINYDYRLIVANKLRLVEEKKIDEAKALSRRYGGPIVDIIDVVMDSTESKQSRERIIMESSKEAVRTIEKYIGTIATVATISPMLGLLGTVTGMMKSFSGLSKIGQAAHDLLAYGIAEALITTVMGLLVAIPSLIFYNYMVSRVEYYIKEVEYIANTLMEI